MIQAGAAGGGAAGAGAAGSASAGGGAAAAAGYAGIALSISAAIGGYITAKKQAQMQSNYYNFLADQSRLKSKLAIESGELQAEQIDEESSQVAKKIKEAEKQANAAQITQMIAQGISLDSVTAEDITLDTLGKATLDEMLVKHNAELRKYEVRRQALLAGLDLQAQAGGVSLSGQMQSAATRIGATTSLIGGLGQAGLAYSSFGKGSGASGSGTAATAGAR